MRVLYLHQYFATPEGSWGTRSYEFARRLVAAGHAVTVVTSKAALPDRLRRGPSRFEVDGIEVVALDVDYAQSMSFLRRKAAFLEFALRATIASRSLPAPDVVFATSTPLTIALPGVRAARRWRVPLVLELRDLWPSIPIAMGALRNPVSRRLARMLERWAYRSADHIVALSPGIADGVIRTGIPPSRVSVIPNSSDLDMFGHPPTPREVVRAELGLGQDDVLVLYAGSFGRANRVDYLVHVAKASLGSAPGTRFVLVGSGSEFERVRQIAEDEGVLGRNLEIRPSLPKSELVSIFAAADVVTSVFAPIPELRHNSANKFFDGLAAGRPVAINYEGWQADLLRETGAGIVLDADPMVGARQLAEFTSEPERLETAGTNALELARDRFDRDAHARQLEEILSTEIRRSTAASSRTDESDGTPSSGRPARVVVLDLLSMTPFYDARFTAALRDIDPSVRLVAASPHRDPEFFAGNGIDATDIIVDRASRLPDRVLRRVWLRRLVRVVEYHLNLLALGARFAVRPPDVVHSQWMPLLGRSPVDLWFVGFLRRRGIPLVHTVHNVLPHDVDDARTRRAHASLYRSASALICHTEEAATRLAEEFDVPRSRICVIPHGPLFGIDTAPPMGSAKVADALREDAPTVLSLGVIRPYKGLEFLLRSWPHVTTPNARLIVAGGGDPSYAAQLVELARRLDLGESVRFHLDYVSDADHDALHRSCDVVVLPYREISQSGALMTAMAYGRPVVASSVGGFREVIDSGRNGVLVEYGDTRALAATLSGLLEDPDARARMGAAALEDVRSAFSWASIARSTVECYARAMHDGTGHGEVRRVDAVD